jgi:hypothetical protein
MYTISYPSGTLRLDGVVIEQNDNLPRYKAYAAWLAQGNGPVVLADVETPRPVIQINAWQIRTALGIVGLRAGVEAAVAGSGDQVLIDGWEHSPTFSSNHPLTLGMGAAMGQDENAMYDLFTLGQGL